MKRVLLVTTTPVDRPDLAADIRRLLGDDVTAVRVIAPAAKVSRLDWLTNAEDDARAEARDSADTAAEAIGDGPSIEIDRASHDSDAVQAVEDALRTFDADEIVVLTGAEDDSGWLEQATVAAAFSHLELPVRHLEAPPATN